MTTEQDGTGHPAERPELVAAWRLFEDWCQSWGLDPVPATADMVGRFLAAFPAARKTQARRVRAIRRHHERAGRPLTLPGLTPTSRTVWDTNGGGNSSGADVGEALAQLPRYGAPRRTRQRDASGLRGRRDGFLIVLTGALGLSREQARRITSTDIHLTATEKQDEGGASGRALTIGGQLVPRDAAPDRCPACAVTRWLRVVTALHHGHRDRALDLVDVTLKDETRHDCDRPFDAADGWGGVGPLLLSLDQDGWTRPGMPLSVRSITAILHTRRVATGRREDPVYVRQVVSTRFDTATPYEVYQAAGDLDDQAAQALLRTQQLLAEMEPPIGGLGRTADGAAG